MVVDVAVVGTGPGGTTVAREFARKGKSVVMLEKGRDQKWIGNHFAAMTYTSKGGFEYTEEGINIIRGIITGGSTILYCGSAAKPPDWMKSKYGINLDAEVEETEKELKIAPLPNNLRGKASIRVLEAANSLGYNWIPIPKFMDPTRCDFHCGATCMVGCSCGAKWTAREYMADAQKAGAKLVTSVDIKEVLIQDKTAVGVTGTTPGGIIEVKSKAVVLAAGGIGSPIILQNSGIFEAGRGIFFDPTVMVYGTIKEKGSAYDPPMSVGSYDYHEEEGVMLSHLIDTWMTFPLMMWRKGLPYLWRTLNYGKILGIMVKIKDDMEGLITPDGEVSKPLTTKDRYKMMLGSNVSRRILVKAGADPNSIFTSPVRGTHPGGGARIGTVVDTNQETRIKNLFVSDASVLPEALDRPLVLTIISLSKRLSRFMMDNGRI
jgi:choline dehydrogenase-like flavoprotein